LATIYELANDIEKHEYANTQNVLTEKSPSDAIIAALAVGIAGELYAFAIGAGAMLLSPPLIVATAATLITAELIDKFVPDIISWLVMGDLGTVSTNKLGKGSMNVMFDKRTLEATISIDLFEGTPCQLLIVIPFDRVDISDGNAGSTYPGSYIGPPINSKIYFSLATTDVIIVETKCPVEPYVIDSNGRISGIVNGAIVLNIPNSTYYKGIITLFYSPEINAPESFQYGVKGLAEGVYDFIITISTPQQFLSFNNLQVDTSTDALHEYNIDWDVTSNGNTVGTMKIDNDSDGDFETINSLTNTSEGITAVIYNPPIALFNYLPQKPTIGEQIVLDASLSICSEGLIHIYSWDYGDGNASVSSEANTTHRFNKAGTYVITLEAIDINGLSSTYSMSILHQWQILFLIIC